MQLFKVCTLHVSKMFACVYVYMYDAICRAICYRFSSEEWISTEKWLTMIFSQSFVCQSVWFVHTCCMWILKWQKRIVRHRCQSALLCTCAMQIFFFWCTLHIHFITAVIFDIWKHMKPNGSYTVILTYPYCVCVYVCVCTVVLIFHSFACSVMLKDELPSDFLCGAFFDDWLLDKSFLKFIPLFSQNGLLRDLGILWLCGGLWCPLITYGTTSIGRMWFIYFIREIERERERE